MASDYTTIVSEIDAHISKCGGVYSHWYVGVAEDARDRLFSDHNVKKEGDAWIFRTAMSDAVARQVEDYFIGQRGTRGGSGGGSVRSTSVYAYRIAPHTAE